MKKWINLVICFLLVSSFMLVGKGCSPRKDNTNLNDKENGKSSGENNDETLREDDSEHYEIKIGLWDWREEAGEDAIAEILHEKFNITIVPVNLSWGDYIEKLNVGAATGELPDMFAHPGYSQTDTRATFHKWVKEGVLRALPEDYEKYPSLAYIMKDYDFFQLDGKHYFIPRTAWRPENRMKSTAMWVRKDWMENVGVTEYPGDLESLYDLLKAFTYNDPDLNGQDDTFGITSWGIEIMVYSAFQRDLEEWVYEDGQWIPAHISKRIPEALEYLRKLYKEKILDQDIFTASGEAMVDKFISSKAGAIAMQGEAYHFKEQIVDKMQSMYPELGGMKVIDVLPLPAGPYGDPVIGNNYNHWSGTLFGAQVDDGKMDRMLELFDYLLSEEGLELGRFGIEGEHFKKEGEKYVSLLPIDDTTGLPQQLSLLYPTAAIKTLATWDVDGRWYESSMPRECVDLEKKVIRQNQPYLSQFDPRIKYMSTPAKNALFLDELFNEMRAKAIMEDVDIHEIFYAFVEKALEEKGGNQALAEVNEKAKELGIKPPKE